MAHFYLSVLRALPASAAPAAHLVTVLRVDGAPSLQWVRRHADEIAHRHSPGYCALMVRETLPDDEARAAIPAPGEPMSDAAFERYARTWAR